MGFYHHVLSFPANLLFYFAEFVIECNSKICLDIECLLSVPASLSHSGSQNCRSNTGFPLLEVGAHGILQYANIQLPSLSYLSKAIQTKSVRLHRRGGEDRWSGIVVIEVIWCLCSILYYSSWFTNIFVSSVVVRKFFVISVLPHT